MSAYKNFTKKYGIGNDLIFVALLIFIIGMLIIPLPTMLIDILLAINLSISVIILMVAVYLRSVLDITTFPAILLVTTIFRLALTVSTTRLILGQGDAGHIVDAFGKFVVSGNLVVGMIIFFIVSLVQFMVITKGAERIAEVGARFTLDSLPGKQMAIDADVRAGEIDKAEAKRRRGDLEKEMQFHGSMDGAMKFVKGDAIAGLIVIFVNLIGGTIIGVVQRGLPFGEAIRTYSLLTVGDGLIAQIPAMLISVAAGVIVTRVQEEEASNVGSDIGKQLLTNPKALSIAAVLSVGLGLLPGFPLLVFLGIAGGLGTMAYFLEKNGISGPMSVTAKKAEAKADVPEAGSEAGKSSTPFREPANSSIYILTGNAAIKATLEAANFVNVFDAAFTKETNRVGFRRVIPGYVIDEEIDGLILMRNGYPALTLSESELEDQLKSANAIIAVMREHLSITFDSEMCAVWLESIREGFPKLVSDIEQAIPFLFIVDVIRDLLEDGLTLKHPRPILEALLRAKDIGANIGAISDLARSGMKSTLSLAYINAEGKLPALMMDMPTEEKFRKMTDGKLENAAFIVRDAGIASMLQQARQLQRQEAEANGVLSVICPSDIRRAFRAMLRAANVPIPVIGISEIQPTTEIKRIGMLSAGTK
jgi:type III secretion protein V